MTAFGGERGMYGDGVRATGANVVGDWVVFNRQPQPRVVRRSTTGSCRKSPMIPSSIASPQLGWVGAIWAVELGLLLAMLLLNVGQDWGLGDNIRLLRICIFVTGVWWLVFSIPTIVILKDKHLVRKPAERTSASQRQPSAMSAKPFSNFDRIEHCCCS